MAEAKHYDAATLTAMIIDDQDPIRKAIKRILLDMGFTNIVECLDGAEALKHLDKSAIDFVVSDIYMKVDGFEVLTRVRTREFQSDIPFIMVSGEGGKDDIIKAVDKGASDYILKPFQAGEVVKKIDAVLEKYYAPTPSVALIRQGERMMVQNKFEEALQVFDKAVAIDNSMRARHFKAVALAALGKTKEAMVELKKNVAENASFYKSYGAMADIYLKAKKPQEAIENLKLELELNPKQPDRQMLIAGLMMKEGDFLSAVDHFREVLKEIPKSKNGLLGVAKAYAKSENLEKGVSYLKRLRRYYPDSTTALETMVNVCVSAGDKKRAEMELKDERRTHPERTDTYGILAKFLIDEDKDAEAKEVITDLLKRSPDHVDGLRNLGLIQQRANAHEDAIESFIKVLKKEPTAMVFAALGQSYLFVGKVNEAMGALDRSLMLDPRRTATWIEMARAHQKSEQFGKAAFLFRKAIMLGADAEAFKEDIKNCEIDIKERRRGRRPSSTQKAS